jgi:hypothetical protein
MVHLVSVCYLLILYRRGVPCVSIAHHPVHWSAPSPQRLRRPVIRASQSISSNICVLFVDTSL